MISSQKVKDIAHSLKEETVEWRRHFHAHPELSLNEFQTAKYISDLLSGWGIKHRTGIAGTGIEVVLEGRNPSKKTIALRADLDALPITEENNVSYKSQNEGVMHACGHDMHTASLLGTLRILNSLKADWEGNVKFIFQPAEEKLPGGASLMIKEGILKNPEPSGIFGQHVFPSLETGKAGFRSGQYMASSDELYITVTGRGGHAAMPSEYNNPLFIAARLLRAYEQLISEFKQQSIPTVLSFGKITGNGATNIVPDKVYIEGTFRTMEEDWRKQVHKKLTTLAKTIGDETGSVCEMNIIHGYPSLINHQKLTERARKAAEEFLGKENVVELEPRMTSEDFAYYSQVIPGCFYRIGTGNKAKGIVSPVHTPTFNIDENALETGCGLMAWLALKELNK